MIQLVVLLGNPGAQYAGNRHNAAWMMADALPFASALSWQKKFNALHSARDGIHYLKPQAYMNRSGEAALATASFYKIDLDSIMVVHDEIELPFGTVSLKFSGGLGGHNGLRSIKACFGSADFWRLRIGLGRPDDRVPGRGANPENNQNGIAGWVLSDFTAAETQALAPVFSAGAQLLVQVVSGDPQALLPEWAKKNCLESRDT